MLDFNVINAWKCAAGELEIKVEAPFLIEMQDGSSIEVEAWLPQFGVLIVTLGKENTANTLRTLCYSVSEVSASSYGAFEKELFIETLNDWNWIEKSTKPPHWYTGQVWA